MIKIESFKYRLICPILCQKKIYNGYIIFREPEDPNLIKQVDLKAHLLYFDRVSYPEKIDMKITQKGELALDYSGIKNLKQYVRNKLQENPGNIYKFEKDWGKDSEDFSSLVNFLETVDSEDLVRLYEGVVRFYDSASRFRSHFTSPFYPDGLLSEEIEKFRKGLDKEPIYSTQQMAERILIPRTSSVGSLYWNALHTYLQDSSNKNKSVFFKTMDLLVHGTNFKTETEKEALLLDLKSKYSKDDFLEKRLARHDQSKMQQQHMIKYLLSFDAPEVEKQRLADSIECALVCLDTNEDLRKYSKRGYSMLLDSLQTLYDAGIVHKPINKVTKEDLNEIKLPN